MVLKPGAKIPRGLSEISDHPHGFWGTSDNGSLIRVRSKDENNQALIGRLSWDRAVIVGYWCCALVQESSIGVRVVDVPLGDQRAFCEA